jgi:RimJ/RimL family protein N-acetyltransferase
LIETARLRLRAFYADDLDGHARLLGDREVMRHIGGRPFNREEAWRRLLSANGLWSVLGYGYWAVERKEDAAYLGQVGFADFKRDLLPSIGNIPEIGWMFLPMAQGQGYALEAVGAALKWADEIGQHIQTVAIIAPSNAPSIRLARKVGFDEGTVARYGTDTILLFRRRIGSPPSAAAAATPSA